MTTNFLRSLWREPPEGYIATWTRRNTIRFFPSSEVDEADAYMKAIANHEDVYFTVALLGVRPVQGRGAAKDAAYLPCMHADFDMLNDLNVHAKTSLPQNIEELLGFLSEINIPKPSIMVNSGNGAHVYWCLKKPIDLRGAENRKRGAALLSGFQKTIIKLAKARKGWDFDNTSDLARVLRYPGTKNHKTNPPKNVEVI